MPARAAPWIRKVAPLGTSHANITARTRFTVPRIANATVNREELIERLDAGSACDLTLIAAAPGSGKTALLTQWADSLTVPVAWLSCDGDDLDPSRFWRDVIAVTRAAWPEVPLGDGELTEDLDAAHSAIEIADELAAHSLTGVIVIDDFHLAAPEPATMVAFIDALPATMRLVLGTRHDPLFPLGRMRVHGRLLELRQADLRLTDNEIQEALANLGVALDQTGLDDLAAVTEGWAAGVHLAGLSLKATPDHDTMLRRLVETDRSLVDFLMNEVIELQTPDMQDFLLVTSELEAFDSSLCDVVRGRADSAVLLDQVRSANLFLIDLENGLFRYHHLFGEFLRARFRRLSPQRVPIVHREAARAFNERGDHMPAIRHSVRAGDIDDALAQLTAHMAMATTLDDQNMGGTVALAWLAQHGEAQVTEAPQRVLSCVLALDGAQMVDQATWWLERVGVAEADIDDSSRFMLEATRAYHLLYIGDPGEAFTCLTRAKAILDEKPIETIWAPTIPLMFLHSQLWLGDVTGADRTIDAQRKSPHHDHPISSVRMPGYVSQIEVLRGDFIAAQRFADQAGEAARRISLPADATVRADAVATRAELAIEDIRLSDAEDELDLLMRMVDRGRRPLLELKKYLLRARIASAQGDDVVVDLQLELARRSLPTASDAVVAHIDRAELCQALRRDDLSKARSLLAQLPLSNQTELCAARVHIHNGDQASALAVLRGMPELATPRLRIEHGVLMALATSPIDGDSARHHLHQAIELARTMGYRQTIIGEGPALWELLRTLPAFGAVGAYVDQLLVTIGSAVPASRPANQDGLVEPLSERELTVLRYLASRLDATEIATALYLSVNTVRSHVKSVYRKLEVNSRADAVQRARTLGLI